jgi:hypothetical protein
MKYCPKCGSENPDSGLFCMGCGERFPKEAPSSTVQTPTSTSSSYQPTYTPGIPEREPTQVIQHVREKYGNLIFSSNYNALAIGALVFGLTPLISIGVNLLLGLFVQDSDSLSILLSLFGSLCFGFFIYGIYAISQESLPMNEQLKSIPLFLTIYVIGTIITGLLFDNFVITETMSLEQVRDVVQQGMGVIIINVLISLFLLLGAIKFTSWFEEFVTMLGAPYNGPTNRFRWFGILTLVYWVLLAITFFMLLSAIENLSYDSINNASMFLTAAAFVILTTVILQIIGGYKIYSVLNNIRQGKYDGTYQQNVMTKYQI